MKKTVKMFALTAAAVLGLGLSQAGANDAAAPAKDCGRAVQAAAPVAADGSALGSSGLLAQPTPVSARPQMDGVSDAFLAAIGEGGSLRPGFGICYAFPCVICCCDGSGNCECTFTC